MKKRLLYMLVVLGGIFSGSCESYLEEVPQNKLKPNTTDDYDQLLNYGYLTEQVVPYLDILSDDVRLVVLGTGDWKYEQMFIEAKRRWPDKVSASIMFSGDLANRIYAGADMFLMPSKFEPCGLAQMIALRYGTIPIVRETGGLKDTVHAFVDYAGTGNGFTFASYNAHDMLHVIREACGVFRFNKPAWSKLIMQGMQSDFSWGSSADKYIEVYKTAMGQ